jgi:hypothetical protein
MQGGAWVGLLRRIPASLHDCLNLMTTTGTEIVLQRLIRLERDFLVALGRPSGTTDQPKVIVVPYDQMTYLSFGKRMTDEEIQSALGNPGVAGSSVETAAAPEPDDASYAGETVDFPREATPAAAASEPTPAPEPAGNGKTAAKMAPPSKSILLARLRERLANETSRLPGR